MGNILLAVNVNMGSFHVILRSEPVAGIKNNYTESTILLGGGLTCLCSSYRGISIKLSLFHNQLQIPCSSFKVAFILL